MGDSPEHKESQISELIKGILKGRQNTGKFQQKTVKVGGEVPSASRPVPAAGAPITPGSQLPSGSWRLDGVLLPCPSMPPPATSPEL